MWMHSAPFDRLMDTTKRIAASLLLLRAVLSLRRRPPAHDPRCQATISDVFDDRSSGTEPLGRPNAHGTSRLEVARETLPICWASSRVVLLGHAGLRLLLQLQEQRLQPPPRRRIVLQEGRSPLRY